MLMGGTHTHTHTHTHNPLWVEPSGVLRFARQLLLPLLLLQQDHRDSYAHSQCATSGLQNAGAEAAMEWVLSHMEDPDFNDPLPAPAAASAPHAGSAPAAGAASAAANPESVAMLTSFGFNDVQASAALQARASPQAQMTLLISVSAGASQAGYMIWGLAQHLC